MDWTPVDREPARELRGTHVTLRPIDPRADAGPLFEASRDPAIWTYLNYGPYETAEALQREHLDSAAGSEDPVFYAVARPADDAALGVAAYLRIDPEHGVIEIGHIWLGAPLQRTTAATEAIFLLAAHALDDLGYRRLEWKCNAANAASRRAAERFGFTFEGIFRNHMVVKGHNRDTAWYSIIDDEWPAIKAGFEEWLRPENFDEAGRQKRRLSDLTKKRG